MGSLICSLKGAYFIDDCEIFDVHIPNNVLTA